MTCDPERVCTNFQVLQRALKRHANIDLNLGKTRVWNAAGEEPPGLTQLLPPAQAGSPVWVGDPVLPPEQQGVHALGTPVGHLAFQKAALAAKRCEHDSLLDKLPSLPDIQSAWLILLMCAALRSNYLLSIFPPTVTEQLAAGHDHAIARCLSELLGSDGPLPLDGLAPQRARLPLRLGGLCLRPALATRGAAYWASWADALPTLRHRVPRLASAARPDATACAAGPAASAVSELMHAAARLRDAGYAAPGLDELTAGGEPPPEHSQRVPGDQSSRVES